MDAEEKTKYRDESSQETDVEAHRYVTDEAAEDEADKTKTKTKYRSPEERDDDPGKYKY